MGKFNRLARAVGHTKGGAKKKWKKATARKTTPRSKNGAADVPHSRGTGKRKGTVKGVKSPHGPPAPGSPASRGKGSGKSSTRNHPVGETLLARGGKSPTLTKEGARG